MFFFFYYYYQIKQSNALTSETKEVEDEPDLLHSISSENNSNQIIHVRF